MTDNIKKVKFKENSGLEIEVVPLKDLTQFKRNSIILPHRTNFYHIFLFENCQPAHFVDFEPIKIKPYTLLFIDKDRVHKFDRLLDYAGQVLVFTYDFFCITENDKKFLRNSILFNDITKNATVELNKGTLQLFKNICNTITAELSLPTDNLSHIFLKNILHNFLLLAEREKRKSGYIEIKKSADLDYTYFFRDLLESSFKEKKAVKDYSSQIFITEKRLGQATSKILGKSPKEIINERVLLEAKRLLVYSFLSIKEIAQELGFEDNSYFVRYFHKNTGNTPLEYREMHHKS